MWASAGTKTSADQASEGWAEVKLFHSVLFDFVTSAVAVLWLGSFLADHWRVGRLAVPALVLHLAAVVALAVSSRQLAQLQEARRAPAWRRPRLLTRVRDVQTRSQSWTLRLAPLLWTPLALVGAESLFRLDVYAAFGPLWVAANLVVGLVWMAVVDVLRARRQTVEHRPRA